MTTTSQVERLAKRSKRFELPAERMRSLRSLPTGRSYRLKFKRGHHLCVRLWDNFGNETLPRHKYKITGDKGASFEGETDDSGTLFHENVPRESYKLEVFVDGRKEPFRSGIATVTELGKPIDQRVRNVALQKLHVQLLDHEAHKPVPGVPYVAEGSGQRLRGTTDAEGKLMHAGVALGVYTLILSPAGQAKKLCTKVPSIDPDAEPLQQRVLGLSADEPQDRHLRAKLFDHFGLEPLAEHDYSVKGSDGTKLQGKTDKDGQLEHRDVSDADFEVSLEDPDSGLQLTTKLAWVEGDDCIEQRVRGYGAGQLHVRLFSACGRNPLSGYTVLATVEGGAFKFQGRTNARGVLGPVEAPHGILSLAVRLPTGRFAQTRVPTVDLGGAAIPQRVLGA